MKSVGSVVRLAHVLKVGDVYRRDTCRVETLRVERACNRDDLRSKSGVVSHSSRRRTPDSHAAIHGHLRHLANVVNERANDEAVEVDERRILPGRRREGARELRDFHAVPPETADAGLMHRLSGGHARLLVAPNVIQHHFEQCAPPTA